MLGTIIINTVCILFDCLYLLRCYRYFSLCLVLYVLTYFNAFSLTHCVCTYWWITYFHSQLSLWNGWSVLGICSLTRFSPLASGFLLKCPLLLFFFRCLVCHSPILCAALFDYRWHNGILVTLLSWISVGMISFFHGPLPLLWSWVLRWSSFSVCP